MRNHVLNFQIFFRMKIFLTRVILKKFTIFETFLKAINGSERVKIFQKCYYLRKCKYKYRVKNSSVHGYYSCALHLQKNKISLDTNYFFLKTHLKTTKNYLFQPIKSY